MNKLALLISAALYTGSAGATIYTYTNDTSIGNAIPLGYTVPIPVESLTPIDGFRTYQSLHARHQQMASESDFIRGQIIGQTFDGEDIWLYTVSDEDSDTHSGATEAATLINGGIHAREWQSPEAVTGFIEALFENRNNAHVEAYLVDNVKMGFIPVLNIDGFKQTQRHPDQVTNTISTPREGRMRRKNMRGVDHDIQTDIDVSQGSWQLTPQTDANTGYNRYKTDTFTFTLSLEQTLDWSQLTRMALSVNAEDMVRQPLDANPATVVDWDEGNWRGYENSAGENQDDGGVDNSFRLIDDGSELFVSAPPPVTPTPTTPTPPAANTSSGGGSFGGILLGLLVLFGVQRQQKRIIKR
jgi:hypothetical protein